ncbi:MAG: MATE family efflux transporter [Muribaculaceae bacterium]|nr:MATE family efflux transporter [Alistipes senegalensis]MCM1473457.1 MATE family efflux transporter [Muribaculaceae bacterium]
MKKDLTTGNITSALLAFAGPMIIGNLLQQIYNVADTLIVGRCLGKNALAAVGSTYTLITFLYSIIIGLCMGSGALASYCYGEKNMKLLKSSVNISFIFIGVVAVITEIITISATSSILKLLKTPPEIIKMTEDYVKIIISGIIFIFLYNFYTYMLRGFGNSVTPLIFLGISSVINIILDVIFVKFMNCGVKGAAYATLIAQAISGIGIALYSVKKEKVLKIKLFDIKFRRKEVLEVIRMSFAASVQQSVMNLGILMIQGLVNSFGTTVMAAFTVAVKIDALAYMPAQEFGNAFSMFISQNYGANKNDRIKKCVKKSLKISVIFCILISVIVVIFSKSLMKIFVSADEIPIIQTGKQYLVTEGSFYVGIGILFLLYGYYRGINKPEISLILTIISLGTRVVLAYLLSDFKTIGVFGIWISIPIGWILADIIGYYIYIKKYIE